MAPPSPRTSGRLIDMRSDTVTKPTDAMRQSAAEVCVVSIEKIALRTYCARALITSLLTMKADVGDDVYGEDPSVNRLQENAAKLMGKEAAILVPTGTMGNLSAVLAHCPERGTEVSHMLQNAEPIDANIFLCVYHSLGSRVGQHGIRRVMQVECVILSHHCWLSPEDL